MRLLLDTHVFLWAAEERLAQSSRAALEKADAVVVSAASAWEIEIKRAKRRLELRVDPVWLVDASGFDGLDITFAHASAAGKLPPHHHDPFDRMLVAQAQLEGLTLVSADPAIARYDVALLQAERT